ncbi:hypothetical protein Q1W73_05215 [Asticcacaulis sp. ZE23SCel15]|uniref:hypothetical protein n=1 Tax=Asticcacaulis sp. ZE23SCel15 TaxID=3059027 RepID=UPI00265FD522|nr:hypothetical protein [Asticcacaulis sp. ZE23SCel15]WKL58385.1 hypothetical protein Q1W73_05215 [Asticcacaulis sp. ZE23SCel15]
MKHDLSIDRADIDSPLNGLGFGRFSDIVSGSLFRGMNSQAPSVLARSIVVTERDLGIDFGAFRTSPTEIIQIDGGAAPASGRKLSLAQIVALVLLSVIVLAVAAYGYIYATEPYKVSGLLEYYLMYLPIPVDYN